MKNPTKTPITRASLMATASCNNRWIASVIAGTSVLGSAAMATTWDGSTSTAWNDNTNWVGDAGTVGSNAVININSPKALITADIPLSPVDVFIGNAASTNGLVDHTAGLAGTGLNNWMFVGVGNATASGTYNCANTATTGGTFTGFGQGTGSLNVGGTSATSGRLYIGGRDTAGAGTGVVNVNTTGTLKLGNDLVVGSSGGTGTLNLDSGTITSNGWNFFGTRNAQDGGNGKLRMSGGTMTNGTTNAAGCRTYIGLGVATGSVEITGGTYNNNKSGNDTQFIVGANNLTAASTPTLTITGGTLNAGRLLTVGGTEAFGGNGGSVGPGKGSATINGAGVVVNATGEFWVGQGTASVGQVDFSAGTINSGSWVAVGRGGGTGTFNMTGGTWTKTGAGSSFIVGASGPGTLTQSAGLIDVQAGDTWMGESNTCNYTLSGTGEFRATIFQVGRNGGATGNVALNGGTLRVTRIVGGGGVENISFNGTQIVAKATDPNFIGVMDAGGATIDAGGLKVDSAGFNLTVPAALDGAGGITKSGLGTLTLSSTGNTYTGSRIVQAGQLVLNATGTGTGAITVSDGAALGIASAAGTEVLTANGLTIGTSGATTFNLNRGDLIGVTPTNALLKVTGPLVRNGTATLNVSGSRFAVGSLPLIAYDATQVSGAGTLVLGTLPDGVIGTLQNDPNFFGANQGAVYLQITSVALPKWTGKLVNRFTTGSPSIAVNTITVGNATGIVNGNVVSGPGIFPGTVVTGVAGNVVTLDQTPTADGTNVNLMFSAGPGANPGVWDTTTTNWVDQVNGAASVYANPNPVLFDDDAPGLTAVTLNTSVSPSTVTFNNTTLAYSLSGTGAIGGVNGVVKKGAGDVTMSTANTYDGVTRLEGGTLTIATIEDGGVTSPIGDSSAASTNLAIAGGILKYTGPTDSTNRGIFLDGLNGGIYTDNDLTITGQVQSNGTSSNLRKQGAGNLKFTFGGTNTLSSGGGITDVEGGSLTLDGTAGSQVNSLTGELWVGSEPNVNASLTVLNTTLNVSSWLAIARGNGDDGVTTVTVTNSTLTTGNFSNGFANGLGGNASEANVTVTNSNWTNAGTMHFSEQFASTINMTLTNSTLITTGGITDFSTGTGTTSTLTIAGTSEMRTNRYLLGLGTDSIANVIIKDSGHLNKTGGDWMSIGNGNNGKGFITVQDSGKLTNVAGDFNISDTGTSQGTLTIKNSAQVTTGGATFVGKNSGTQGTLDIQGGTFTATASFLAGGTDNAANTATAVGFINQTGGDVILNGDDNRTGCSGTATWTISGGTVTSNGWMTLARYTGGFGTMNASGGTVTQNHANRPFRIAELGTAVLNVSGTAVVSAPNSGGFSLAGNASASGTINLNGGTLIANKIVAGGADGNSVLNLNGGLLKASTGAALAWIPAGLDSLLVNTGGANIDTNGQIVGIAQAMNDGGGALTKSGAGTLQLNGLNTYFGTTTATAGEIGGTGSVAGELVVQSGASVGPGAGGVGTFTVEDTLASGSSIAGTYVCEINGATADQLAVAGDLNVTGATLDFNALAAPTAPSYVIATYSSITGTFAVVDLPAGYTLNYGATQLTLNQSGTPYSLWAQSYGLDPLTDGAPGADKDGDGQINSVEFALGGSPVSGQNNAKIYSLAADSGVDVDSNSEAILTIAVRTGTPAFAGTPSPTATQDGYTYTIEGSTTLGAFTTVVTPTPAPVTAGLPAAPTGYEYRSFSLAGSNGVPTRGFMRVVVTP
ncbi:beta strand repeat-containing protein [Luteolibacter soli]|uniref:Autotransporter-associated beta strand repeat-containing protein n=1 Tax=Luteolibacter soli TaxID=3135280 RepID=A0ABU9B2F3_9BACT